VAYYCAAGDCDAALAVDILGRDVSPRMGMTYEEITIAVLRNSSRESKLRYPVHFLKHAFNLLDVGRLDIFKEVCADFERMIAESEMPDDGKDRLLGELTLLSSFGEYNDISKMAALIKRAHELTGGRPSLIRMNDPWTFGNPSVLFMYHSASGRLDDELSELFDGCGYYFALVEGHGSGGDFLMEAEVCLNRGEFEKAELLARKSLYLAERKRQNSVGIGACLLLAQTGIMTGDARQVRLMRDKLSEYVLTARRERQKSDRQEAEMADSRLALLLDRPWEAAEWIQAGEIGEGSLKHIHAAPYVLMLYGKFLLSGEGEGSKKSSEASKKWLETADIALELSKTLGSLTGEIYFRSLTACAYISRGEHERAVSSLDAALAIALPDRLLLPFAEHCRTICAILSDCAQIDALAKRLKNGRDAYAKMLYHDNPFGLREQEYRAACLAAKGLKNPEIADRLCISEKTVRNCLSRAYGKMGASRVQLASALNETGLDWESVN
jgi:LuxR family maltose regulon positive regulatory protein